MAVEILAVVVIAVSIGAALVFRGGLVGQVEENVNSQPFVPSRIFEKEELSGHTGADRTKPILLSILGTVFDVSKGEKHYGVGGSYSFFTGKDGTRAFVTGDFTEAGLTDNLEGLSPKEIKEVMTWFEFYRKDYTEVGKLVGRFYDATGAPTEGWARIREALQDAEKEEREDKEEKDRFPICNSKWSQAEGGEVWCDQKSDTLRVVPRLVSLAASQTARCACVNVSAAEEFPGKFARYKECDKTAVRCKV